MYSFSYELRYSVGAARQRIQAFLADRVVVIGFRPQFDRFMDFMQNHYTHAFMRSHLDPILHFNTYTWNMRIESSSQEISTITGLRFRPEIGKIMTALNQFQDISDEYYRDYHLFVQVHREHLDQFTGDYCDIPKDVILSHIRPRL